MLSAQCTRIGDIKAVSQTLIELQNVLEPVQMKENGDGTSAKTQVRRGRRLVHCGGSHFTY